MAFGKENVRLYRDYGLLLVKGTRGRTGDQARKQLRKLFEQFELKITSEVCHQSVNFVDITLKWTIPLLEKVLNSENQLTQLERAS